jgi:hypothetical protein
MKGYFPLKTDFFLFFPESIDFVHVRAILIFLKFNCLKTGSALASTDFKISHLLFIVAYLLVVGP